METQGDRVQPEAPVDAVGERGEVAYAVLDEVEGMAGAAEAGLEAAHSRVDPLEFRQVPGPAVARDGGPVPAAGISDTGEAGQAVGKHHAAEAEAGPGPVGDGLAREAGDRGHLGVQRMPVGIERDRRDERHLVLGAAPDLAAGQLAAQVDIVHLGLAAQRGAGVALGHGLHQLLPGSQAVG